MIWLTWRQHRLQAATTIAFVAAVCALLLAKGSTVHSFFDLNVGPCLAQHGDCGELTRAFENRFSGLQLLIPLVLVLPMLVGLFWGAPLVARELESGTFRLAWTQSVTRRRWLLSKVGVLVVAAALLAAAYASVSSWFAGPFNQAAGSKVAPGIFDLQGVVPIAYTVFALALGVAIGAVVRRVLPAMAGTLGGFVAARVAVALFVRPHLFATRTATHSLLGGVSRGELGDWVTKSVIVDGAGRVFSSSGSFTITPGTFERWCPGLDPGPGSFKECARIIDLHVVETYHPASGFWTAQTIETALFLGAAAVCIGFAAWWVRRRCS